MEFNYAPHEGDIGKIYLPTLPISINGFPIGNALVDTGADITILPLEISQVLGIELNTEKAINIGSAGGGKFTAIPSKKKIKYSLEHSGFRPIQWNGTVFFAPRQPTILLGQYECLSELKITLDAKNRILKVEKSI